MTEYLAVFNEEYPDITVNVVRESTGIITARLLAEKDNPQADVVWGTAYQQGVSVRSGAALFL